MMLHRYYAHPYTLSTTVLGDLVSGYGPSPLGRNWLANIQLDWAKITRVHTAVEKLLDTYKVQICILSFSLVFTAYLLNAVVSGNFQARVVLKPLVSLIGCLVACSARISVNTQTHRQTHRQTDRQRNQLL